MLEPPAPPEARARLRLRSLCWALLAGLSAGALGLSMGLEPALRAGGSGLFYGLLAFHLQRVDPDDGHLQAGLVGAVCGIHSLGLPLDLHGAPEEVLPGLMMALVRAWLPLIGAALVLHAGQRSFSALRP
ncbi:hypothetical protein [Cyanobium sp. Morenito 9A2]|uniref:hypothetical protein n=1 Tax=Cyanobium sp. Morenito 9A2 TaxID=2823718 RepID=UPI0020CD7392|nr:hypothetical protein [Cyanobium sp. Morenito 9A2]MCP9851207.1 hypothetical protein [Cyanobium sp. Morenito 9A2]